MYGITEKQKQALDFISGYITRTGISPSYDEIAKACGIRSKSGIVRLVDALEKRGRVKRLPGTKRSLCIVQTPTSMETVEERS